MRCLSLWEPWASLMVAGLKRVETRGQHMAKLPPGPLLIHSAKRWMGDQLAACRQPEFTAALAQLGIDYDIPTRHRGERSKSSRNFAFGRVIGCVNVLSTMPTEAVGFQDSPDRYLSFSTGKLVVGKWERAFGDYTAGRIAILTQNTAERFPNPQEFRGMQGLFDVPDSILEAARKPMAEPGPSDPATPPAGGE